MPIVRAMDLNQLLHRAVELGASDIHLKLGAPPMIRRDGAVGPLPEWPPLDDLALGAVLDTVTAAAPAKREAFLESGDLDIAYSSQELPRFRCNVYRQRGAISFAFR